MQLQQELQADDKKQQQQPSTVAELLHQQEQERQQILAIYKQQQRQLTPQLLDRLLQLANTRGHWQLLLQLLLLPKAQQLPASTLSILLRSVIRSKDKSCTNREALVEVLCQLPASAQLSTAEVCRLLTAAVKRQQLDSCEQLANLPVAWQMSSSQVMDVAMAAVNDSWDVALPMLDSHDLLDDLQPQHLQQLLQQAVLLASVAGVGMPQPWCDVASGSPNPAGSATDGNPAEYRVVEFLVYTHKANNLPPGIVQELLLLAAGLGNVRVLSLMLEWLPNADTPQHVVQVLKVAAQLRNSSMISAAARKLKGTLVTEQHKRELADEVFSALVRTNEMPQLLHLIDALAPRVSEPFIQQQLPRMVDLATQLNRCSTIKALCSRQGYPNAQNIQLMLPQAQLTSLVRMAVTGNNPGLLHSLLQLPAAAKLPAGGLQLVMEECKRQALQPGSSRALRRWLRVEKLPSLRLLRCRLEQQLEQLVIGSEQRHDQQQQQDQAIAIGQQQQQQDQAASSQQQQQQQDQQDQAGSGQQQQHDQAGSDWRQQQQQQQMNEAAVQQAIKAGSLPDELVRAQFAPGPAKTKASVTALEYLGLEWRAAKVERLLTLALQLPAGQQQQAWVELLCHSQLAGQFDHEQRARLLVTAVQTGFVQGSTAALRMLCRAWRQLCDVRAVYPAVAAAVQLGYMPALQVLLGSMPAEALQFAAGDMAALLRWGICSNGLTSSSSSSSTEKPTTCGGAVVEYGSCLHPMPPTCTAAGADVFAALCQLPAAHLMDELVDYKIGLLLYAMQQGNVEAVQQLCELDGPPMDANVVRGLLRWARVVGSRPGRDAVVGALCGLDGFRLRCVDVSSLLQLYDAADALMGWSAAESEQAGVVPAEVRLNILEQFSVENMNRDKIP
jgi:hypothetical protein